MALHIKDAEVERLADELAKSRGWTKTLAVRRALERAMQEIDQGLHEVDQSLGLRDIADTVLAVPALPARKGKFEARVDDLLGKVGLTRGYTPQWVPLPGVRPQENLRHVSKRLYTTSEAALYLGCTEIFIEELAVQGQLTRVVRGNYLHWDVWELDALIEGWKLKFPKGEAVCEPPKDDDEEQEEQENE